MTDYIPILKRVIDNYIVDRMPKTVNGYSIEWCVELVDMTEHMEDAPEGCICVLLKAWAYYETEDRVEEQTEYGLKTKWVKEKNLVRRAIYANGDVDNSGHVSRGFHYHKDWIDGNFDFERMSDTAYIFSKVPKEKMEHIRDTMQGFVSDVVQFCVDLERWK